MERKKAIKGLLFCLPSFLGTLLFFVVPSLMSVSCCFFSRGDKKHFMGLACFKALFANAAFIQAMKNTLLIMGSTVPLLVFVSLLAAVLLEKQFKKKSYLGALLLIPMAIPSSSMLLVWQDVLAPDGVLCKLFGSSIDLLESSWSQMITLPIVAGQTFLGIMTAYGFGRLKFKGSEKIFFLYILMMLMPFQVTLVPHYIVLSKLGLIDHYGSLILPGIFSSFAVFFLKQYMEKIDEAYLEEARLLGANEWQILWQVIVPMCKPVIVSSSTLLFLDYWNMVDQPIHYLNTPARYPLSVYLSRIVDENVGIGFVCSLLYMILPLLVVFYGQEDLTASMRLGSLK